MRLIRIPAALLLLALFSPSMMATAATDFSSRFARLALDCIYQDYPNYMRHHVGGPGEVGEPHQLYPAFYGCFDLWVANS
jgi:hypothetical protein